MTGTIVWLPSPKAHQDSFVLETPIHSMSFFGLFDPSGLSLQLLLAFDYIWPFPAFVFALNHHQRRLPQCGADQALSALRLASLLHMI